MPVGLSTFSEGALHERMDLEDKYGRARDVKAKQARSGLGAGARAGQL